MDYRYNNLLKLHIRVPANVVDLNTLRYIQLHNKLTPLAAAGKEYVTT